MAPQSRLADGFTRIREQWAQPHWTAHDRRGIWLAYEDLLFEECLIMLDEPVRLEGGAQRNERKPSYDLVEACAVELIAERLGVGAVDHGRFNYKNGGPEFVRETYNHLFEHVLQLGKRITDDDLAAIGANFAILAWFRAHKSDAYNTLFERGPRADGK